MKENANFFTRSFLAKIICSCLCVFMFFAHSCATADFDDQELVYTDDPIKVFDYYPPVAERYEDIYDRFLNGKLIYKPDPSNDERKVELRIADLEDPLNGIFDLSCCGNMENYLSISTGYRKRKRLENASKAEIWFAPRFLIEKELNGTASHFKPIMDNWKQEASVGMFWTWGGWGDMDRYDYLTTENMDNLSKIDLYESWIKSVERVELARVAREVRVGRTAAGDRGRRHDGLLFHVSFVSAT